MPYIRANLRWLYVDVTSILFTSSNVKTEKSKKKWKVF